MLQRLSRSNSFALSAPAPSLKRPPSPLPSPSLTSTLLAPPPPSLQRRPPPPHLSDGRLLAHPPPHPRRRPRRRAALPIPSRTPTRHTPATRLRYRWGRRGRKGSERWCSGRWLRWRRRADRCRRFGRVGASLRLAPARRRWRGCTSSECSQTVRGSDAGRAADEAGAPGASVTHLAGGRSGGRPGSPGAPWGRSGQTSRANPNPTI